MHVVSASCSTVVCLQCGCLGSESNLKKKGYAHGGRHPRFQPVETHGRSPPRHSTHSYTLPTAPSRGLLLVAV